MSHCPVPTTSDPILIFITLSSSSPHLSHLTHLPLFLLSRLRLPAQVQTNNQGSWGGKGTKKSRKNSSKKSKFLVQTAGIEPTKRKDFESSNVIISEKKDRKASVFQVKDLPYPYTSVEQYEARFKTPLGSEWNSRSVYQKENMPRVTKKVSRLYSLFSSFLLLLCYLNISIAGSRVLGRANVLAWSDYRTRQTTILGHFRHLIHVTCAILHSILPHQDCCIAR